jgi:hypothetical protein
MFVFVGCGLALTAAIKKVKIMNVDNSIQSRMRMNFIVVTLL